MEIIILLIKLQFFITYLNRISESEEFYDVLDFELGSFNFDKSFIKLIKIKLISRLKVIIILSILISISLFLIIKLNRYLYL